jgi:inorganic pyrophosphatase
MATRAREHQPASPSGSAPREQPRPSALARQPLGLLDLLAALPPSLEVEVELARGATVKRDAAGAIAMVGGPLPWAYGRVLAWPAHDGAELDALVVGAAPPRGFVGSFPVVGVIGFIDAGLPDSKVVVGRPPSALERAALRTFFGAYALWKRALTPRTRATAARDTRSLGYFARTDAPPWA